MVFPDTAEYYRTNFLSSDATEQLQSEVCLTIHPQCSIAEAQRIMECFLHVGKLYGTNAHNVVFLHNQKLNIHFQLHSFPKVMHLHIFL